MDRARLDIRETSGIRQEQNFIFRQQFRAKFPLAEDTDGQMFLLRGAEHSEEIGQIAAVDLVKPIELPSPIVYEQSSPGLLPGADQTWGASLQLLHQVRRIELRPAQERRANHAVDQGEHALNQQFMRWKTGLVVGIAMGHAIRLCRGNAMG